jgi:hypothetical protein
VCWQGKQPYLGRRTATSVWVLFEFMTRYTQVNKSAGFEVSDRDAIPAMGLTLLAYHHRHIGFFSFASNQGSFREDRLA